MKKAYLLTIILVTALATSAAAESLTLTTYYPAPFGAYDRMRFVPRPAIGGTSCDLGTIFYNSDDDKLTMCAAFDADGEWVPITGPKGGIWQQEDLAGETNVYLTDWQNMDLRVGIGTDDPTAMFEILDTGQTLSGERGHFSIFGDANIDSDVADMNFDGGPDANFTIVHNGADGSNSRTRFMWVDPNTGTWHNRMDIWNSGRVAINSDGSPWGNFQVDGDTAQFGVNAGWANAQPWPTSSDPWPYIWFNGFNNSGACTGWTCTPGFNFRFFRGTSSARTTAQSDDWLGYINFGSGDTANGGYTSASIGGIASENQVFGTNQGGQLVFNTTANGSISLLERMRITHDGKVGVVPPGVTPDELLYSYLDDSNGNYNSNYSNQQAIKGLSERTTGSNIGVNGTAAGVGATTNKGLYGWATGATFRNWGLHVDAGLSRFDDDVIIGNGNNDIPANPLHIKRTGGTYDSDPVYLHIQNDVNTDGSSGIIFQEEDGSSMTLLYRSSYSGGHENGLEICRGMDECAGGVNFRVERNTPTVGIGTGDPRTDKNLHIKDPRPSVYFEEDDHADPDWWIDVLDGVFNIATESHSGVMRLQRINSTFGKVGINKHASSTFHLDVEGAVRGASWSNSDARLKKDVVTLSGAMDKVMALRGVSFHWKDPDKIAGRQLGVIAQEVESVVPEVVLTDTEGIKTVAYDQLVPLLIEALKEQQEMIKALKQEMRELKDMMRGQ